MIWYKFQDGLPVQAAQKVAVARCAVSTPGHFRFAEDSVFVAPVGGVASIGHCRIICQSEIHSFDLPK